MKTAEIIKNELQLKFNGNFDLEKCKKENCRTFGNVKGCKPQPEVACGNHKVDKKLEEIALEPNISKRLKGLVTYYNEHRAKYFLACLENKESLADCVTGCLNKGQLSCTHDAKFHSHIRRFPSHREAVLEVANKIKEEEVLNGTIDSFEDLIGRIDALYGYADKSKNHVKFFGPLYIYDTAIRIGYHCVKNEVLSRIMPVTYVYLQAGALKGATNLMKSRSFDIEQSYPKRVVTEDLKMVVPELNGITVEPGISTSSLFIEDFLCVFEDYL